MPICTTISIVLDKAGLLLRIDAPVNKDTEMHPLVRWQFRGGIAEQDRKAFLFTDIVDSTGRRYDIPVVIGALAANAAIYRIGMDEARRGHRGALGACHRASGGPARRGACPVPRYRYRRPDPKAAVMALPPCRSRSRRPISTPRFISPRPASLPAIPTP